MENQILLTGSQTSSAILFQIPQNKGKSCRCGKKNKSDQSKTETDMEELEVVLILYSWTKFWENSQVNLI